MGLFFYQKRNIILDPANHWVICSWAIRAIPMICLYPSVRMFLLLVTVWVWCIMVRNFDWTWSNNPYFAGCLLSNKVQRESQYLTFVLCRYHLAQNWVTEHPHLTWTCMILWMVSSRFLTRKHISTLLQTHRKSNLFRLCYFTIDG